MDATIAYLRLKALLPLSGKLLSNPFRRIWCCQWVHSSSRLWPFWWHWSEPLLWQAAESQPPCGHGGKPSVYTSDICSEADDCLHSSCRGLPTIVERYWRHIPWASGKWVRHLPDLGSRRRARSLSAVCVSAALELRALPHRAPSLSHCPRHPNYYLLLILSFRHSLPILLSFHVEDLAFLSHVYSAVSLTPASLELAQ